MNVTKNVNVSSFNWPRRRDEAEVGFRLALGVATEKPSVSVEDKRVLEFFFFFPKQCWTTRAMQIVFFVAICFFLVCTAHHWVISLFIFWGSGKRSVVLVNVWMLLPSCLLLKRRRNAFMLKWLAGVPIPKQQKNAPGPSDRLHLQLSSASTRFRSFPSRHPLDLI